MSRRTMLRASWILATIAVATIGFQGLRTEAAPGGNHCTRGVKTCSASHVGKPCDPNNLNILCSAQKNGSYCCLAYAL